MQPLSTPPSSGRSAVDEAVATLRSRVLDGVLGPGARIVEEQAAAELGVSRHTLRAAMRQLVSDGLLRHEPHRGVHVPILTAEDITDVFRIRALLEHEAMRDVASRAYCPPDAVAALAALESLSDDAGWHEVVEYDRAFHRALIDAAGSVRISRTYAATEAEIVFCLVQLRPHYDRPVEVAREHRELLEPVAAGDVRKAQRLLDVHLRDAERNLLGSLPGVRAGSVSPEPTT